MFFLQGHIGCHQSLWKCQFCIKNLTIKFAIPKYNCTFALGFGSVAQLD